MSRTARIVLAGVLLAVLLPAAWTSVAHGAATTEDGLVDQPAFTRRDAEEVERIARADDGVATALGLRPDSALRVRYLPSRSAWRVSVRDSGSMQTLATVEVDDATGKVLARTALPLGDYPSRSTSSEVKDAALADARVRRVAREFGGVDDLRAVARFEDGRWEVDFFRTDAEGEARRDVVLRVEVVDATREVVGVWTGIQIAWKMARGERGAFGGDVNERFVWLPLVGLFLLLAIDWTRLRSWRNADILALVALGISHELFLQGSIDWSVPLAVPPMLWLAASMAWRFRRGLHDQGGGVPTADRPRGRIATFVLRPVPTMLLVVLCVALAGIRIGVTLDGGNVIDVGYAGVAGARLELDGTAPWGHMPSDNPHGDTYGPANYLAYVPAVQLLDSPGDQWGGSLPAAQAVSIAADLGCALLLALIGWRWISRRAGVLLAALWLACPWTTWALASGVNDALVALPLLAAFAFVRYPAARGALVGVAAMVKVAPVAVLAPMLHVGVRRRLRQSLVTSLAFALVVLAGLAWVVFRLDGSPLADLRLFWERTVAFQAERGSPFSVWGLYEWHGAQRIAQLAVVLFVAAAALVPRVRDAWQVAAGIACVLILLQLVVTHWFYLYVPWFVGFVLLVGVVERERAALRRYAPAP